MQDRYPPQPEAEEARIRYLESMKPYVMTPEDERKLALQMANVSLGQQYTRSQLQNAYWMMPREPSDNAKAILAEQMRKPSLIERFKAWMGRKTK